MLIRKNVCKWSVYRENLNFHDSISECSPEPPTYRGSAVYVYEQYEKSAIKCIIPDWGFTAPFSPQTPIWQNISPIRDS